MRASKKRATRRTWSDVDAELAAAARGVAPTSDDAGAFAGEDRREIDAIGAAAGVVVADGELLGGPDATERRDAHRWELDPASADPDERHPSSKPLASRTHGDR